MTILKTVIHKINSYYRKIPKTSDTQKIAVIILKLLY